MDLGIFSVSERERVRDRVLELAASDGRIVAGAVVGSLAQGQGDRWSDLDLTFAVAEAIPLINVLEDWTRRLADEFNAAHLLDLESGASIYRVFLLPGCLQLDLSFTPVSQFGAKGPNFKLLFGHAHELPHVQPPAARELFGHAAHHLLRARFCIERGRLWQAEYWISSARDHALRLACRRRGLPASHGRGSDDLPADAREHFASALVTTLKPHELLRALGAITEGLLREAGEVGELATRLNPQLRMLTDVWDQSLRLDFEPLTAEHAQGLFAAMSDPAVYQHIDDHPPASVQELAQRFGRMSAGPPPDRTGEQWLNYAVRVAQSGDLVGRIQATVIRDRAEVAYVFGTAYGGKGYATEAMEWLHRLLRERMSVGTFWATTRRENSRSISLLRRLGYAHVNEWPDLISYGHGDVVYRRSATAG
jgi:RimJ/RimL family protein N-acetyltransferase